MSEKQISRKVGLIVAKDNKPVALDEDRILRLDLFEGWEELDDEQQLFLTEFAKNPFNEKLIAMQLGYNVGRIKVWKSDPIFHDLMIDIEDIYTEVMREADYRDALGNSKIRGRQLTARKAKGFDDKPKEGSKSITFNITELVSAKGK